MDALWRPIQNNGPTMLSLACDNEKFIVDRDGTLHYGPLRMSVRFGAGTAEVTRLDFGLVGLDTTVRPSTASAGLPLRIAGRTFSKGIGLHANAEVVVPLGGRYQTFEALVGVFPSDQPGGTATLQIDVDGQRRFDSGVMKQNDPARPLTVSLPGASEMILRVSDAGDGILNDAVNLAEARLMPADSRGEADAIQLSDLLRVPRPAIQRRIEGAGLPIVVNTTEQAGILYTQRTFVAPAGDGAPTTEVGKERAVCVVEFVVENRSPESRSATAWLGFAPDKAGASR